MHSVGIELHTVFAALAEPTRIRILRLLVATKDEACLCELCESLDEPEYKLSRHIKVLKAAGLLTSVRDGKWIYHGLVKEPKFLKAIHRSIEAYPDVSKTSAKDLIRFNKRLGLRERGRCRSSKVPLSKELNIG